ncbi:MAG: radical SAM protein [Rhodothermales bacterium]|nr:radical SAM protein [Rhodothermales bacterium]
MNVGIIDLLGKEPPKNGYSRLMRANNASIMAQVVGVWAEELGHRASIAYYSGNVLMSGGLPDDIEIVFINAFSQTSLLAYAMSNRFRSKGLVTVLGGPHARSYPEDAAKHFDYVVGLCNKSTLQEILDEHSQYRPLGRYISATEQPASLPGLRQRWKFLRPTMEQAKVLRLVPMIGSLGCPYTCSFCIDAVVPYQPLQYDTVKDDLRFLRELKLPRSVAAWHDPNFGIRFDEYMDLMEDAIPPGSLPHIGEMSLSLLSEDHLKRLKKNRFLAIAPGIESWYDIGGKSKLKNKRGEEKVRRVAEHANMVQRYIPYTQCNLIFGLDADEGPEPYELTKLFIELAPAVYPHFALLSAFGRNAELNLGYQKDNRVLPVPFHFLDLIRSSNVIPRNYTWLEFYDHVVDAFDTAFSRRAIRRRFTKNSHTSSRFEQLLRGISSDRRSRLGHQRYMREQFNDPNVRAFFEGETRTIPDMFVNKVQKDLGPLWEWLPEGTLDYDPNAYLNSKLQHPLPVLATA